MTNITHLPEEMIVMILENKSISIEDVINFKSTCKKLQGVTLSNYFWKNKLYQRCSTSAKQYYLQKKETLEHSNFEGQIRKGIICIKKLYYYISMMSDNNVSKDSKEDLKRLLHSVVEKSFIYHFVLDEFDKIISTQLPWLRDFNLTIKYNCELIYNCLKKYRFIYKQGKFINKPIKKQIIERQVIIITQYFLPHLSYSVIATWLDDVAQEVLSRLKIIYPTHTIFSTSLEQFLFWKINNIYDNHWDPIESLQIMDTLEKYIFSKLEIDKLLNLLILSDIENKYKNYISEFSSHILTITYQCLARRLGICCILMPINIISRGFVSRYFRIEWKPKYNIEVQDDAVYFYMADSEPYPSNIVKGRYNTLFNISPYRILKDGKFLKILIEMLMNFEIKLKANNMNFKWSFKILYDFLRHLKARISTDLETGQRKRSRLPKNIRQTLSKIMIDVKFYRKITDVIEVRSDVATEGQLRKRMKVIKYAVGMIVKHYTPFPNHEFFTIRDICHYGVIIGWHKKYLGKFQEQLKMTKANQFPYLCPEYFEQCICDKFLDNIDQPYYIILTENNRICYVPQNQISICSPREIDNIEIGRYFYRFQGTHYVPNKNLEKNYPNDAAALFKILSNQ